jgi:uncharacterized protein
MKYFLTTKVPLVLIGAFLMALGSVLMIHGERLGLHPFDVLEFALTENFGLSFGIWHWIVGAFVIFFSFLINFRLPKVGVFLETFLVGAFIDFLLRSQWIPNVQLYIFEWTYLIFGIVLVGAGTGMYISAGIGAGPSDWFSPILKKQPPAVGSVTAGTTKKQAVL